MQDGNSLVHYSIKDGDKLFVALKAQCENERTHIVKEEGKKTAVVTAEAGTRDGGSGSNTSAVVDNATVLRIPEQRCPNSVSLPTSVPPNQCGGCWKPKTRFWERLNTSLRRYFAQDDVDKIIRIVREVSDPSIQCMLTCDVLECQIQ